MSRGNVASPDVPLEVRMLTASSAFESRRHRKKLLRNGKLFLCPGIMSGHIIKLWNYIKLIVKNGQYFKLFVLHNIIPFTNLKFIILN